MPPAGHTDFTRQIIGAVRRIPYGKVATYGQIALLAGNHQAARQVVRVLHTCSRKEGLPWHRVINGRGKIALHPGCGAEEQQDLLEEEGVVIGMGGRIDLDRFLWHPRVKGKP